ncbi:MAG TPA: vWA domain-containing protein [Flavobacterium sp.]|nr:vWA domain-containing protein [Flavobacterium sp.]
MKQKHQVHNLIILDESGSMEPIKTTIINGFNELVQSIKGIQEQFPDQEHFISIISFNGFGNKIMHFIDPVSKLNTIDSSKYKPDSLTPLYDALGFGLSKLEQHLTTHTNYNVLVTVLTDGEENASKEYSGLAIKNKIDELSEGNWTFTYIGTDHDVEKMASTLSIKNTMKYDKNEEGINSMFEEEFKGRVQFFMNVREGKNFKENYFTNDEKSSKSTDSLEPNTNSKILSIWKKITAKKSIKN